MYYVSYIGTMRLTKMKYGFLWVTIGFFVISVIGHWVFAWFTYLSYASEHGEPVEISEYVVETIRDTLENWQSEFLQLVWQVAGLAYLLYIGSPQSKEGDERKEEKIDLILKAVAKDTENEIKKLEKKYPTR